MQEAHSESCEVPLRPCTCLARSGHPYPSVRVTRPTSGTSLSMHSCLDGATGSTIVRDFDPGSDISHRHARRDRRSEASYHCERQTVPFTQKLAIPSEPPQTREVQLYTPPQEDTTIPHPGYFCYQPHSLPWKFTVHWSQTPSRSKQGLKAYHQDSSRLKRSPTLRIIWLLEELSLPYGIKTYKSDTHMRSIPKFRSVPPFGKSPVIEIETPNRRTPLIIAESGHIVQFLSDHFGQWLIPFRYAPGQEADIGSEGESWLKYSQLLHYADGNLKPWNCAATLMEGEPTTSRTRFFCRPFFCPPGWLLCAFG